MGVIEETLQIGAPKDNTYNNGSAMVNQESALDKAAVADEAARNAVIELRGVSKTYGRSVVIEHLDLAIRRGEFLTLLGPSGCGKTTTLKMVAGFEAPTRGSIVLEGRDVSDVPPYGRNLNTVFQQYALFPHMNVFDNVAFGPRTQGVARDEVKRRVETMLNMVHMLEHSPKKPHQLSGGQQQRVALARALVNYPSALLLDEPLSALDVKLRRSMQLELKRIQAQVDTTFIFVTHDQEEALTMSSRIAVMNQGRIEQLGSPEEVYHKPATPFVANFIGQANLLECCVHERDAGGLAVEVDGCGRARVEARASSLQVGQKALLMLRPEHLMLRAHAQGDEERSNRICGHLREIDFRGAMTRYVVATDSGHELTILLSPCNAPKAAFSDNEPVTAYWDDGHAWLIDAQSDSHLS